LQDIRVNTVLSGQAGAPFAGQRSVPTPSESLDPYARAYKELLAWPVLPHLLREQDQTWTRMRWYGSGAISNQTLMLQRLLVESPPGSTYQNVLLSLLLADEGAGVATVYSRTRPVGVDIAASDSSGAGGFASTFLGTMKSIGQAIKGSDPSPGGGGGGGEGAALDVEHLRQWLLTLDESARVELLDRFVTMAGNPTTATVTARPTMPAGLAGATAAPHSLLKESFNASFHLLTLRHLPLLCEVAQFLAISVRVTKVELTKPRNKKLAVPETP
jgi:hypothetical protein